jgi:hypothetical protein
MACLLDLRWTAQLVDPQPSLLKANAALLPNHKMIEYLDVRHLAGFDQAPWDQDLLIECERSLLCEEASTRSKNLVRECDHRW